MPTPFLLLIHNSTAKKSVERLQKSKYTVRTCNPIKAYIQHMLKDRDSVTEFVTTLRGTIGQNNVIDDNQIIETYVSNVSAYQRNVTLIITPTKKSHVSQIIDLANQFSIPLYPISRGKNWGLGSKLPVSNHCAIVDLKNLNSIKEINTDYGYATIEPGVTQGQLAGALKKMHAGYFLDVTGSGKDTSIVGNILERGIAYNSLRIEKLINLEIVLGNGQIIKTGFNYADSNELSHLFKYGIGPSLEGLFIQSNFGIVTSATIELCPIPEKHIAFIANLQNESKLGTMVNSLRLLSHKKTIECVVHLGNERRREIALTPMIFEQIKDKYADARSASARYIEQESHGTWSAVGSIMGSEASVRDAKKKIKQELAHYGKVSFIDLKKIPLLKKIAQIFKLNKKEAFLNAVEPLLGLTQGEPSNEVLRSIYWPNKDKSPNWENPDIGSSGITFCTPIIPMDSEAVNKSISLIKEQGNKFGLQPAITLNTIHGKALECVISVDFDKQNDSQVSEAHRFIDDTLDLFINLGYLPYRIDIDNMSKMIVEENAHWQLIKELKTVLDPNNIIAPKRYNLI